MQLNVPQHGFGGMNLLSTIRADVGRATLKQGGNCIHMNGCTNSNAMRSSPGSGLGSSGNEPEQNFSGFGSEEDFDARDWLAALIAGSQDAIISKDLGGHVRSWNAGATSLFGYTAEEMIGRPITLLIPEERLDEEPLILGQIRQGKRVEHFETQRRRKDGALVDLSLTISPIRNHAGEIVGASKIARDITERLKAQEAQQLMFGEMQHRIKNLFALTAGIVSLSAKSTSSSNEVVRTIHERLAALARAHDLTMPDWTGDHSGRTITLPKLLSAILQPYGDQSRIAICGAEPYVGGKALTNLALLLHELATNAAKYGSLSVSEGRLDVHVHESDSQVHMSWTETHGPQTNTPGALGFGSRLEKSLMLALGAAVDREWRPEGLTVTLAMPKTKLAS